jgi:hypothetical protein
MIFLFIIKNNKKMSFIPIYIKNYYSYKEHECIMHYINLIDNIDYTYINLILSELNDKEFIVKKEKDIIGKKVIPFNYKSRSGDIMTYLDKYIIITFYPIII